jgi:hypothetical protein
MAEFDFNCPKHVCDLGSYILENNSTDQKVVDDWFLIPHESHEKDYEHNFESSYASTNAINKLGGARRQSTASRKSTEADPQFDESNQRSESTLRIRNNSSETNSKNNSSPLFRDLNNENATDNAIDDSTTTQIMKSTITKSSVITKKTVTMMGGTGARTTKTVNNTTSEDSTQSKRLKVSSASGTGRVVNPNGTISVASRYLQSASEFSSSSTITTTSTTSSRLSSRSTASATSGTSAKQRSSSVTRPTVSSSNNSVTLAKKPTTLKRSVPSTSTSTTSTANKMSTEEEDETALLTTLLRKHNEKFAPIPAYEPPRHSVREVRAWEKTSGMHLSVNCTFKCCNYDSSTGRTWNSLKPEEREKVNAEISRMKANNLL